jgi:hypothetical protein
MEEAIKYKDVLACYADLQSILVPNWNNGTWLLESVNSCKTLLMQQENSLCISIQLHIYILKRFGR